MIYKWVGLDFFWAAGEIVAVVACNAVPFTPQNDKVVNQAAAPSWMVSEEAYFFMKRLKQHLELAVKATSQILIAWCS